MVFHFEGHAQLEENAQICGHNFDVNGFDENIQSSHFCNVLNIEVKLKSCWDINCKIFAKLNIVVTSVKPMMPV